MLLRKDGTVVRLDKGGMILGVMPALAPYEQETVSFLSGDLLVLFTDGVSEAMSKESVEYEESHLEEYLPTIRHLSAEEIVEAIYQDVLRHTRGASQSDDITMMVVKVS
jgi:sigma-B regulation protein RsbU (phosphoserine phosphatase)